MNSILVTGGAGFIGSEVTRQLVLESNAEVLVLDKLTYAGNLDSLRPVMKEDNFRFIEGDICDEILLPKVFRHFQPDAIMNLAAESHVDRSIDGPAEFIRTNIGGTSNLLQASLDYWRTLGTPERRDFRFLHVSTDEVYGSLGKEGLFTEDTPYSPNSPYSASKAASDHLVNAWHKTYGLPTLLTNCSNNYGPYHFPEKLIPLMILNALEGKSLPIYGKGDQVRDWLYVADHARALLKVLEHGCVGETYNIGGHNEKQNIEVVKSLCVLLDQERPREDGRSYVNQITYVADRPGHDQRYAIDASKIGEDLNWKPQETFETGLSKTVNWYLKNQDWWERVRSGSYRGERLGVSA